MTGKSIRAASLTKLEEEKMSLVSPGFRKAATIFILLIPALLIMPTVARPEPSTGFLEDNGVIKLGQPSPSFTCWDLDGNEVTMDSLKGRPVLMDFSSIFCGSCQETIKEFTRLQKEYEKTDLALIVVTDGMAPVDTLKNFFSQQGASYTVLRDEGYKMFEAFGVNIIPFQVVIDRAGIIRRIHVGFDPAMETGLGLLELIRN